MRIEAGEFGTAPVRHRIGKLPAKSQKNRKGLMPRILSMKEGACGQGARTPSRREGDPIGKCGDAIAERAIADLVMVLGNDTNAMGGSSALCSPRGAPPRYGEGSPWYETFDERLSERASGRSASRRNNHRLAGGDYTRRDGNHRSTARLRASDGGAQRAR
jgi:hypothetical protein